MPGKKRNVRSNGWTVVGQISSLKGSCIQFESSLEEGFVYMLIFDSDVTSIESQPVSIKYLDEQGRQRVYNPDFLVKYRDRPARLFEVKPHETVEKNDISFQRIKAAGEAYAKEKSWIFDVVTDKQIKTDYGDNARFLFRYERYHLDTGRTSTILNALSSRGKIKIVDLLAALTDDSELASHYLADIWTLIFNKKIVCNLFEIVAMNSSVWVFNGSTSELKAPYKP